MTCVAFHVHDSVDTNGVGISTGAGTDGDDFAPDMLADVLVGLVHIHHRGFHLGNVDGGIIYRVYGGTIAVEEGEAFG